jgi:hypothetical protein
VAKIYIFAGMKSIFAVILSSLIVAQSLVPRAYTGLLASADVWQHYQEHRADSKQGLSLWDFLEMHYGSDSKHAKQSHHHLPQLDLNSTAGFCVLPDCMVFNKQTFTYTATTEPNFFWLNLYSFVPTQALICPPRA